MNSGFTIATTSYIWPNSIWENCVKLQHLVEEVAILFFETIPCLNYSKNDFPIKLKDLNLKYHIHLPLDLPWEKGSKSTFDIIYKLVKKSKFLNPTGFVLHPPPNKKKLIPLLSQWEKYVPFPLFLENTQECDLVSIWDVVENHHVWICLDVGHLLKYNQFHTLELPNFFKKTKMIHLYGPAEKGHGSLKLLNSKGKRLTKHILKRLIPKNRIKIVIEVFNHNDLIESLDIFSCWIRNNI